jgi:hypothetical protein
MVPIVMVNSLMKLIICCLGDYIFHRILKIRYVPHFRIDFGFISIESEQGKDIFRDSAQ